MRNSLSFADIVGVRHHCFYVHLACTHAGIRADWLDSISPKHSRKPGGRYLWATLAATAECISHCVTVVGSREGNQVTTAGKRSKRDVACWSRARATARRNETSLARAALK